MSDEEEMDLHQPEEEIQILADSDSDVPRDDHAVEELVARVQEAIEEEEQPTVTGNVLRRVIGAALLLVAVLGFLVAVTTYRSSIGLLDEVSTGADSALAETISALESAQDGLTTTSSTINALGDTLATAEVAALRVSQTLSDTKPLLDETNTIVTETVPDSLDTVQSTIPDMVQVAAVIDDTLTTLSGFNYTQSILGIELNFGLGIEYEPAIPFDVSVEQVGSSLDGVPEQMRDLGVDIDVANGNLQLISADLEQVASDIAAVNSSIEDLPLALNQVNASLTTTTDQIRSVRAGLPARVEQLKMGILIFTVWLGAFQLAPLYLAYELLTGQRD